MTDQQLMRRMAPVWSTSLYKTEVAASPEPATVIWELTPEKTWLVSRGVIISC
jgi:hypothetical protein